MRLLWLIPDNGLHLQTVVDFRIYRKLEDFDFFSKNLALQRWSFRLASSRSARQQSILHPESFNFG